METETKPLTIQCSRCGWKLLNATGPASPEEAKAQGWFIAPPEFSARHGLPTDYTLCHQCDEEKAS